MCYGTTCLYCSFKSARKKPLSTALFGFVPGKASLLTFADPGNLCPGQMQCRVSPSCNRFPGCHLFVNPRNRVTGGLQFRLIDDIVLFHLLVHRIAGYTQLGRGHAYIAGTLIQGPDYLLLLLFVGQHLPLFSI